MSYFHTHDHRINRSTNFSQKLAFKVQANARGNRRGRNNNGHGSRGRGCGNFRQRNVGGERLVSSS